LFAVVLIFCAPVLSGATAEAAPGSAPVFGVYVLHLDFGRGWERGPKVTLYTDGSGSSRSGWQVDWTQSGTSIKVNIFNASEVISCTGTLRATGISSKRNPGTLTDSLGDSGQCYGVKKA
jgi:hypothetical protein